jgi:hypothetical protein
MKNEYIIIMENIRLFEDFVISRHEEINEKKKAEKGLMHKLLDIPADKKVSDVYKSPKKLATDLLTAVKDADIVDKDKVRSKATSMLAFAANWPNDGDASLFDKALKIIKDVEIKGVPKS